MSNKLHDLLDRGAARPASDVDVDALVRTARGRRRRRVGAVAGAIVALVAVVVGAVALVQPSSRVSIPTRPAAPAPDGWKVIARDDVSIAIPPEWTQLDEWNDETITVGTAAFPRTGTIIPCHFPNSQVPSVSGTWVTVFAYRRVLLPPNDELPLSLVPALRTTDGWVGERPADLRNAVTSTGSCGQGSPQAVPVGSTLPAPTGRYEVVAFHDADRTFVALLVTMDAVDDSPFDLAYRVLNTITVDDPGPTPTMVVTVPPTSVSPTIVSPTTVPTGPVNASGDEAAVRDVFLAWLDATQRNAMDGIVEDFASIAATHLEGMHQHSEADLTKYSGRVDSVTIIDDTHADVRYTVLFDGRPQFSNMPGAAIKIDGKWMVTRETVCNLLTYGGLHCPPRA